MAACGPGRTSMKQISCLCVGLVLMLSIPAFGAQPSTGGATGDLLAAAADGDTGAMRVAMKKGADVNATDDDGFTPLMLVSAAILVGSEIGILDDLLTAKAKIDAKNDEGVTALMIASRNGRVDTVKALIAKGANVNLADNDGWTSLMYAALNGQSMVVDALIKAKANIAAKNSDGWPAIVLAMSEGRGTVIEKLLAAGAAFPTEIRGVSTLFFAIDAGDLVTFRAALQAAKTLAVTDKDGWSPVEYAAAANQEQMLMDLLRAGASATIKDKEGKTALDRAKEYDYKEIVALLGGPWEKPELDGTRIVTPCEALGGDVETWVSWREGAVIFQTLFPRPVSWYVGGGLVNRAKTSKTMTYKGSVAGDYFLDLDNNPKTGSQKDILWPYRNGAELTIGHDEYQTSVNFQYRASNGQVKSRQVTAEVIDVSVYKGDDMVEPEVWTDGKYPHVLDQAGVLRTVVPAVGLGIKQGSSMTVTTQFGRCASKPASVKLD